MKRTLITIAVALFTSASAEAACTTPSLEMMTPVPVGQDGFRFALGDVDRDGNLDIASHDTLANEVRIHPGNGDGTFDAGVPYTVTAPRMMHIADVNGDQWPDLIMNTESSKLGVMLNDGDGTFGTVATVDHEFNTVDNFDSGDLDNDGDRDVVIWHLGGAQVLWNNGSGAFPTKTSIYSGPAEGMGIADLNNDGRLDLAVAVMGFNNQGGSLKIFLNTQNGFPATANHSYTFANTQQNIAMTKGDFNSDGRADFGIAFWDGFATYLGSTSNNGTFTTGMSMTFSGYGTDFSDVTSGDYNEDGFDDLAFASSNGSAQWVAVSLGNGNFQNPLYTRSVEYGHVNQIETADMDRDGRMDFVRYDYDKDEVQIFRNACTFRYTKALVASSQNPAVYGTALTFTATVTARGESPAPTGSVTLYVDDVMKETKDLSGGTASFTPIANLTVGYHGIRVEYVSGAGEFANANSSILAQEITRPPFGAPVAFSAFRYGASTTAVHMTWVGVQGASEYEVFRMNNGGTWASIGTTIGEDFADLMVPDSNPQVYAVRALRTGDTPSATTAPDIATTFIYSTASLSGAPIRAVDLTELRTLVNGLRTRVGLSTTTFTDASLAGQWIKAIHVTQLRTALQEALSAIGRPTPTYTQPTLTAGVTKMKAADIQELRDAIY